MKLEFQRYISIFAGLLCGLFSMTLLANPMGIKTIEGEVIVSNSVPHILDIKASPGSMIELESFSMSAKEIVNITLPNPSDLIYIRVKSTEPSTLNGRINVYGGLYILNSKGIYIDTKANIRSSELFLKGKTITHAGLIRSQQPDGNAGQVILTGDSITLLKNSVINASGNIGGGQIFIGGGWHGSDPAIPNVQVVDVKKHAQLSADALRNGNGGLIVVWSDESTTFLGNISAVGKGEHAQGGLAEVSSMKSLNYNGTALLDADNGSLGNLVLDCPPKE